jgi:hypothetical protein
MTRMPNKRPAGNGATALLFISATSDAPRLRPIVWSHLHT